MSASDSQPLTPAPCAWILDAGSAASLPGAKRIFGLSTIERLERALERAGAQPRGVLDGKVDISAAADSDCIIVRGDIVCDERLLQALLEGEERALLDPQQGAVVAACIHPARLAAAVDALRDPESSAGALRQMGVSTFEPSQLVPAYNPALRKSAPPLLCSIDALPLREIEKRIFAASYKGLTDFVTKWLWPAPALAVTRWLAERRVRPNTVTLLSYLLTGLVVWLFAVGDFAAGLVAAWAMTFLDTVDGKLARVTLSSSRLGNVLDHGLDLVHPPVWWIAWAYGVAPDLAGLELATVVVVGGYLLGRGLEGLFMLCFGMEVFLWRPFDGLFRSVIARRNPNLILLSAGTLVGRPDWGFLAVAAWTLLCNLVHLERLAEAGLYWLRGVPIEPWYRDARLAAAGPRSAAVGGRSGDTR